MSIIKFKAKVRLISESDMEMEDRDLGIAAKDVTYEVTEIAFPSEYIYKIIKYDKRHTLVHVSEFESSREVFFVDEKFEEVLEKWETASTYEEDLILGTEEFPTKD